MRIYLLLSKQGVSKAKRSLDCARDDNESKIYPTLTPAYRQAGSPYKGEGIIARGPSATVGMTMLAPYPRFHYNGRNCSI